MSINSLAFLAMVVVAALLYYVVPVKFRFIVILAANGYFLYRTDSVWELAVWLFTSVLAYFVGLLVDRFKEKEKTSKAFVTLGVIIVVFLMVFLKDSEFFHIPSIGIAPIGISYYSLSLMGYMLDVYWGMCPVERNPLKFIAFAGYFPLLTSGPIVKYGDVGNGIASGVKINYQNISFGAQRVLWGLVKKMIISDRVATIVNTVYGDPYLYTGAYIWYAFILFVIQLYTDFSGCIDIALGVSEMFGIMLPENFDLPFLAESLEEFWRRWHITLGGWLRDYILYPILKSNLWQNFGKFTKKIFGKKTGKKIPVWCGLMISWFLIGFWHGGHWNYIIGVGLFFGTVIILSEILKPFFEKVNRALHINTDCFSWHAFRVVRTFLIFMIGLSFFRAQSFGYGIEVWKIALSTWNPWVLFDGSFYNLGLAEREYHILMFFMVLLIISGVIKRVKGESVRVLISRQNPVARWIIWLVLAYSVIIYGCYGVGFDSVAFIYQKF